MTPAKMFDGDLWMLASDATQMAENAYKKGQADEREAILQTSAATWFKTQADYDSAIQARGKK